MQVASEARYVALTEGIPLYSKPVAAPENVLGQLPYNSVVRVPVHDSVLAEVIFPAPEKIPGNYVLVESDLGKGYVFNGHTSRLPMPSQAPSKGLERFPRYADSLKAAGFEVVWTPASENADGGKDFAIELPASSIYEAFLIARVLFYIPAEYYFPKDKQTVLSSPENPSKSAREGPYSFTHHRFVLKRDAQNQPSVLTYYEDSEVGGREVTIAASGIGWSIRQHGWAH